MTVDAAGTIHISKSDTQHRKEIPPWSGNTPCMCCDLFTQSSVTMCVCVCVIFDVCCKYHRLVALTVFAELAVVVCVCVCARSARGWGAGLETTEFLLAFGAVWLETLKTLQSQIREPILKLQVKEESFSDS